MKRKAMKTENKPVFIPLARRFRPLTENSPAQRDSKFSKLRNSPFSPSCLFSPLAPKTSPAQPHSKFSNLGFGCSYPVHNAVFTGKRLFVPGTGKTIAIFNFLRIKLRFFG
jgi:hypothetical protein